ncbi:response regulator [Neptunomonas phycophila]|uniref:response regulator n=1 Tax=Neptunomonas phycophila TaxID=1572645 RepID=UPI003512E8FD
MNTPIPVVICDDSSLARKHMARSLQGWNVDITFASNGLEALEAIQNGLGHLVFLDLNMPLMDGYQVLERIQRDDLPTLVLVVSGDIQPDATKRVKSLGALDFIKKPINEQIVSDILHQYGLLQELSPNSEQPKRHNPIDTTIDLQSYYQEIANVAMGRAGDRLARLLGVFIHLPIPRVRLISINELAMTLQTHIQREASATVSQGFVGSGIAGEALLLFTETSIKDMATLMRYDDALTPEAEREILIDLANVLSGAFINSLALQLDVNFSQGPPSIIGLHGNLPEMDTQQKNWEKTLSIEIGYRIGEKTISCDLLLLFTEDSLTTMNNRAKFFETL